MFFSSSSNNLLYSIFIFLLAGLTDFLDGYIARKYKLITKTGVVLDPLADKLMLIAVLTCLVIGSYIPIAVLLIITFKEVFMIFCGILMYKRGTVIPSNIFGKAATILFYISIFILAFNESTGTYLLYISVAVALTALINYSIIYSKNKKADDTMSSD
jgi:cardiolipin synthase